MIRCLLILAGVILIASCTIVQQELIILDGLATVKIINNKPKFRMATGLDECKWGGRVKLDDLDGGDHEITFKCKIPIKL